MDSRCKSKIIRANRNICAEINSVKKQNKYNKKERSFFLYLNILLILTHKCVLLLMANFRNFTFVRDVTKINFDGDF